MTLDQLIDMQKRSQDIIVELTRGRMSEKEAVAALRKIRMPSTEIDRLIHAYRVHIVTPENI